MKMKLADKIREYTLNTIALCLVMLWVVGLALEIYEECTDIDYFESAQVTELGQCITEGVDSLCVASSGNLIIESDTPMLVGQIMYHDCRITFTGTPKCNSIWSATKLSNLTLEEAWDEYEKTKEK